ncbi:rho GTPase-activating protein REN1-like isoform X1 [Canna indica]|uniref:Rho GTPase-activating protein REN1-like isoform X1 n=1 Tax=Canna indica TaxID=4628 RepID=A0AAQ3JRH4_9LILI|nr:rho GTPase-activating protein REN1-like isoform X1 [Canna indica]
MQRLEERWRAAACFPDMGARPKANGACDTKGGRHQAHAVRDGQTRLLKHVWRCWRLDSVMSWDAEEMTLRCFIDLAVSWDAALLHLLQIFLLGLFGIVRFYIHSGSSSSFNEVKFPNFKAQKGSEPNLTLGGIDLNNSGSVVVKADKKILTVLFPDGRDGRTFTLKADTSEDLCEWKAALENALAQAPSAAATTGQNEISCTDIPESVEVQCDQVRDAQSVSSTVVGRPVLLALEEIDGSPSFLEKALRFIEEHGIKVEGILRQSADVEEVKCRIREYEQGKIEFSPDEDAHVIGDCIKYVLRELPSSPVPASCCTALVEAYRTDRQSRVDSMRSAIYETFPDPNRHLLERILNMMHTVASNKSQNRMSLPALAACMAPLLLRPLLAGECEYEDNFTMGGDGSVQLMKAAAAANHAQAIVIILLEEYDNIFDEDLSDDVSMSSELYSDSGDGDIEDDDSSDNDIPEDDECHDEHTDASNDNDVSEDDEYHDKHNGLEADIDGDYEHSSSKTKSDIGSDRHDDEVIEGASLQDSAVLDASKFLVDTTCDPLLQENCHQKSLFPSDIQLSEDSTQRSCDVPVSLQKYDSLPHKKTNSITSHCSVSHESFSSIQTATSQMLKSVSNIIPSRDRKVVNKSNEVAASAKPPTVWRRTSAIKNLSMESIDLSSEDESAIKGLENSKNDLQNKFTNEVKENATILENLERRKEDMDEHRLVLEKDIERLREQLQKERDLRTSLESGLLNMRPGNISCASAIDNKTRADLEEIALVEADIVTLKQKVSNLRGQLNHQLKQRSASLCESCEKSFYSGDHTAEKDQFNDVPSIVIAGEHRNFSKEADSISGVASVTTSIEEQDSPSKQAGSLNQNTDQTQALPSSPSIKPLSENTPADPSSSGTESPAASNVESTLSISKNTCSRDENVETQSKESVVVSSRQPFQMQRSTANKGSKKSQESIDLLLAEESGKVGRTTASKKFYLWGDNAKKEAPDSSLRNKQLSHKQQPSDPKLSSLKSRTSSISSSEELPGTAKKSSSKPEETVSPSAAAPTSALTKLTNRLNFLKERRAQLVNEQQLQTQSTGNTSSDDLPPRT